MKRKRSKLANRGKIRLRRNVEFLAEVVTKRRLDDDAVKQAVVVAYWQDKGLFQKHWDEIKSSQEDS